MGNNDFFFCKRIFFVIVRSKEISEGECNLYRSVDIQLTKKAGGGEKKTLIVLIARSSERLWCTRNFSDVGDSPQGVIIEKESRKLRLNRVDATVNVVSLNIHTYTGIHSLTKTHDAGKSTISFFLTLFETLPAHIESIHTVSVLFLFPLLNVLRSSLIEIV